MPNPEPPDVQDRLTVVKKIVRSLLLVVLVAPALVVLGATEALACSCVPPRPDKEAVKDAAAVFTGTMVEADVEDPGFSAATWTFAVDTVYRGDVSETQEVMSETQSAACGLVFKEEKRYAVFAYEDNGEFHTNSCSNTRAISDGKDLKLTALVDFHVDPGEVDHCEGCWLWYWPFYAAGAVVLGAGLVVFFVVRRRRAS